MCLWQKSLILMIRERYAEYYRVAKLIDDYIEKIESEQEVINE